MGVTRREFMITTAAALGAAAAGKAAEEGPLPILKATKIGTIKGEFSLTEQFRLMRELGFDGIEVNAPGADIAGLLAARRETGLPIHGVVDNIHWKIRLSDPDPEIRKQGREGLEKAIRESHELGGTTVLLVPGAVRDPANENAQQVWDRSIEEIRKALPVAAEYGIKILIENVWNGFLYDPNGGAEQTAELFVKYLETIGSPHVGAYFDIGNVRRWGHPEAWIRALGSHIGKCDAKDWSGSKDPQWTDIGEGDVNWPEVRKALAEIEYTGWATAEVRGGDPAFVKEKISLAMDRCLLGK